MGESRYRRRFSKLLVPGTSTYHYSIDKTEREYGNEVPQLVGFESMSDVNNKLDRPESPVVHSKYDGKPLSISGKSTYYLPWGVTRVSNWDNKFLTDASWDNSATGHLYVTVPSNLELTTMLFARLNPSNTSVDLAASAIESIVEFPAILRNAIDGLGRKYNISDIGSLPISYLFGILPIVRMLQSLATLGDDINKRLKQLERLQRPEGRKVRVQLYSTDVSNKRSWEHDLSGSIIHEKVHTSASVSAVVNDRIVNNRGPMRVHKRYSSSDIRNLLISDRPISTLWELLPWSWLIDYFIGVGELLKATSNRIPGYEVVTATFMRRITTRGDWTYKPPESSSHVHESVHASPGFYNYMTYNRSVVYDPSPSVPRFKSILTDSQIGTLIALGTAIATRR